MRLLHAAAVALVLTMGTAYAATDIDFFFPVPVQGKLAVEMQKLVGQFDKTHPDIHVTAVYTGSYDDTNLKTRAAIQAGHPPGVALMSANFIREFSINRNAIALDPLIEKNGTTPDQYMANFWPALKVNAVQQGHVYGVPSRIRRRCSITGLMRLRMRASIRTIRPRPGANGWPT